MAMKRILVMLLMCFLTSSTSAQTWTLPSYSYGYNVEPTVVYPIVVNPVPICNCSYTYCLQTHRRIRQNNAAEQLGRAIGGLISELVTLKRKKHIRKKNRYRRSYSY